MEYVFQLPGSAQFRALDAFLSPWASQVALGVKNLSANAGDVRDVGSILGWGRSLEEGMAPCSKHSCLQHPLDKGTWLIIVHRVAKS